MKPAKIILHCVFLFAVLQKANAQSATQDNKKPISFTVGSSFASRLHYFGRTDSLRSTAVIPSASVDFGNGLYIGSSAVFINNSRQAFQYSAIIAGAGFKFGKTEGFAGNIYADKFFYANNNLVQSSQKGQAGFGLSYLHDIIDANIGGSAVFGDKTDVFASAGIDHRFKISTGESVIAIIPSFTANAGTQNFTRTYFVKRNVLILPGAEQALTKTSRSFQWLSLEVNMPVVWVYKRLTANFTPGYVLPQNVITVAGRPDLSETASNLFYANLGVSFTLGKQ